MSNMRKDFHFVDGPLKSKTISDIESDVINFPCMKFHSTRGRLLQPHLHTYRKRSSRTFCLVPEDIVRLHGGEFNGRDTLGIRKHVGERILIRSRATDSIVTYLITRKGHAEFQR